ncbi:MAG TPA: FHA domain-containing protein, partial [Tepidisphaeraceae bacterium]
RHCRVEPLGTAWRIVDLQSKNGTRLGWEKIGRHILREGDTLRIGRTYLTFYAGAFVPAPQGARKPKMVRPADPHEALTGTVTGFVFVDADVHANSEESRQLLDLALAANRPHTTSSGFTTQPLTSDPASSSWDSIIANASQQKRGMRPMPRPIPRPHGMPMPERIAAPQDSSSFEADMALQASPQFAATPEPETPKAPAQLTLVLSLVVLLATLLLGISGWLMANSAA